MDNKFGMEGIPESENFTERIGTEAGSRWSDVLYKGIFIKSEKIVFAEDFNMNKNCCNPSEMMTMK